jgi:hypothetical protein
MKIDPMKWNLAAMGAAPKSSIVKIQQRVCVRRASAALKSLTLHFSLI